MYEHNVLDTIEEARQYVECHRCIKPPVYNERRLKELPIPLLETIHENMRIDTPPMSPNDIQQNEEDCLHSDNSFEVVSNHLLRF